MMSTSMRRVVSGALTIVVLVGCSSRSPWTAIDEVRGRHTPSPSPLAASRTEERDGDPTRLVVLDKHARLGDYVRYAALQNPGLEALFHEWQAAVEREPQASSLPDPRFTYGYYLSEVETRVGPMQHSLSLSQTLPWFGKLGDRENAATRHSNAAFQRFEAARLALHFRVERTYNELFFVDQSIKITRESIELLRQFERVVRARYRVAAAGHPDVIKIQVELGELEDRLRQLQDLRTPYTARLNAALNRPPRSPIAPPSAVSEREILLPEERLLSVLAKRSPELLALHEEIERERIRTDLARSEGYPDFTVGLSYTFVGERDDVDIRGSGDDTLLGTLSVNLPIWRGKYAAGTREATARRLAATRRHDETLNLLASELQEALFEHEDARRRVTLYRDTLIPKATESLHASLSSFEQGESDYFDLLDTQRSLLEFQLAIERARVDRATSAARIERLVGIPLSDIDNSANSKGGRP